MTSPTGGEGTRGGWPRVATVVRVGLGLTYVGGALVHVFFGLRSPEVYAEITPYVLFDAYRTLWTTLVLPNLRGLLALLVAFEALLGVAVLRGGRTGRRGLVAAHVGVLLAERPDGRNRTGVEPAPR